MKKRYIAIIIFVVLAILGQISEKHSEEAAKKSIAAADEQWKSGANAVAVEGYRIVLDDEWHGVPDGEKKRLIKRVIEEDVKSGRIEQAVALFQKAARWEVTPSLSSEVHSRLDEHVASSTVSTEHDTTGIAPQSTAYMDSTAGETVAVNSDPADATTDVEQNTEAPGANSVKGPIIEVASDSLLTEMCVSAGHVSTFDEQNGCHAIQHGTWKRNRSAFAD